MDWSGDDRVNVCERAPEAEGRVRVGVVWCSFRRLDPRWRESVRAEGRVFRARLGLGGRRGGSGRWRRENRFRGDAWIEQEERFGDLLRGALNPAVSPQGVVGIVCFPLQRQEDVRRWRRSGWEEVQRVPKRQVQDKEGLGERISGQKPR